ncbi:Yip1 domain protein, partial [Trichuris suis]
LTWLTPCHDCSSFLELRLANAQEAGKRSLHSIFFDAVDNYADFLCVHTSFSESNVMERELQFQDFPSDIAPSGLPSSSERDGNLKANSLFIPESAEKSPPLFSLQFCQQFFDVDTAVVIRRVLYSMVPRLNMNFITQSIRPHPDLFGPFWIALTLLFTACVGNQLGEMFNAIHGDGTVRHAVLNFRIVTLMASVIFAYAFLVPGLFIVFFIWRNMDDMYTLLELICSYGYSLSVFIPISLLWAINIQWFRWLLTLFGVFLSGGVLLLSIWPVVRKHSRLVCKMFTAPIIGAYLNSIVDFLWRFGVYVSYAFGDGCLPDGKKTFSAERTVTSHLRSLLSKMHNDVDQAFMHQWSAVSLNTNVSALRFTPQGDILAVAYANGVVRCFQVASGQEVATISTSERPSACNDVCWYPTGHYLFAAKEDGTVIMHDYRMGKLHSASMCHSVAVTYLVAHPKSPLLISCSASTFTVDSTIRFWDLRSVSPLLTVSSSGGAIYTMDCDSSGMRLATGGADGLIHICDATTGAVFDVICGEFNRTPITSVNFSMDGLYLLVSRQEWPVKLWKVSNKTAIRKFIGSKNLYYVIRSKLLGRYVISGSEDGRVFVWDCDSTDVVARLPHKPAVLTVDGCDKQQMLLASASVGHGGSVKLGTLYKVEQRHGSKESYFNCESSCDEVIKDILPSCYYQSIAISVLDKLPIWHLRTLLSWMPSFKGRNDSLSLKGIQLLCMNLAGEVDSPSVSALFKVDIAASQRLPLPMVFEVESRQKLWNRRKGAYDMSPWTLVGMRQFRMFRLQQLLSGDAVLGPVTAIKVEQYQRAQSDLRALISWTPNSKYPSCYYYLTWTNNITSTARVFLIDGLFAYELDHLTYESNYTVLIRSISSKKPYRLTSSPATVMFKSMSCLQANNFSFLKCPPGPVRQLKWSITNHTVVVSWLPPDFYDNKANENLTTTYHINFRSLIGINRCLTHFERTLTLPTNVTNASFGPVSDDCLYGVDIAARVNNSLGKYAHATLNITSMLLEASEDERNFDDLFLNPIYFAVPALFIVLCLTLAGVYMWRQRKRKAPKVDIPMYNVQQVVTKTLDQQLDAPIEHKNLPSDRIQSTDVLCKSSDLFASIEFDALLGEGTFGCIYRAKCSAPGFEKFVAVKTMKGFNGSEAKEHLVKEIELLSRLPKHPNVTEFLGYCDRPGLLLLILEYCPQGNLKRFLKTNDPRCHPEGFEITNFLPPALYYGRQIALGMEHLNAHNLVHRDLAARNILVSDGGKTVKVSDFGLSRSGAIYLQMVGGRLPVRWMAPESIFVRMFSNKSDVWSFGIVLWEIVTVDLNPYPGVDIAQLFHFLKMGYRMEKPENCSQALYSVMMRCWNTRPECRPSFTELREEIEALLPLCTVNTPSC